MKKQILLIFISMTILSGCGGSSSDEGSKQSDINAQALEIGTRYNLTTTADEGTTKYYSLPVIAGSSYSIDVINDASSDNNLTVQIMATGFGPEVLGLRRMISFDYDANETGDLLIKVKGSSRAFFRYILTAHPSVNDGLIQDDASYEPNNSKNAAYPIVNGAQYSSTLDQNDDYDWYALDIVNGDTITLVMSNNIASTSHLHPQLFDRNGNPLTQQFVVSHTEDLNEQISVDYTGPVFLKLNGQSLSTSHRYSFSMMLSVN